jgi:hypothetical protein
VPRYLTASLDGFGGLMKRFIFLFLLFTTFYCFAGEKTDDNIRNSFYAYQASLINNDGKSAVQYLDSYTINYYENILKDSLYLPKIDFDKKLLVDRLIIAKIRQNMNIDQLLKMNGKDLIIYSIIEGWIGEVSNLSLGTIVIDNDIARAEVVSGGKKTSIHYKFHFENGIWKLDLLSTMQIAQIVIQMQQLKSGYNEDDFILYLLDSLSNPNLKEIIFQPLKQNY